MSTTNPNIWGTTGDPNPDAVGQEAHFGWGMNMLFVFAFVFSIFGVNAFWAIPADAVLWLIKESLEALGLAPWEGKQPWFRPWGQSSARDFVYFMLGEATAIGICALALLHLIGIL